MHVSQCWDGSPQCFTAPPTSTGPVWVTSTAPITANDIRWSPAAGLDVTTSATVTATPRSTTTYVATAYGPDGCSQAQATATITVTNSRYLPPNNPSDDLDRNWTRTRRFDADGNVVGESKQFLDELGRPTQAQARNLTARHVLASQTIYGSGGVAVLSTLPAPIDNQAFRYKEHFATAGGQDYGPANFENGQASQPSPLDEMMPGTLGYYYSQNNLWEPTTPATHNPYSLTEPGDGPSGGLRRAAGPGDELAMGKGHEARARQMPLLNELTPYLSLRNQFVPTAAGATLAYQGTKLVSVGANGRETVAFTDQDGQTLAACLSGPQYAGLTLTGSLSASPGPSGPPRYQDIHVPAAGNATLTLTGSGTVSVRNLITGQESQQSGATSFPLAPGFYRLLSLSGAQSFSYLARYGEFSYSYYDDAGRAVATVAPRGTATATAGQLPQFVTRNVYSGVGTLLSTTSPDEGTTQYVYARDGRIRFSQSARQKLESKFSYSNYDAVGRVVESGEYGGGGRVFESQLTDAPASNSILGLVEDRTPNGGLSASNCTQRNLVQYDLPAADAPRPQEFVLGAVARTSNATTTTWYSYDALGRLAWLAQALPGVGTKIVDYTYDFNGNVLTVAYQKGQPDAFYHHYQYDADQRLQAVATSPDGLTKTPQARYDYYLHGPLKRTELAGNLQGIDYAYTVQGWLKSINSAARGLDPGQDAPQANGTYKDLFGLTLDYFAGDYRSAAYRPVAPAVAGVPTRYDGLVRAAGWFAASSPEQRLHSYEYDEKSQLKEAHYGTVTGNVFTAAGAGGHGLEEGQLRYDAHGNLSHLRRTNLAGAATDDFTYQYRDNTNQLAAVKNPAGAAVLDYDYDADGQMTRQRDEQGQQYFSYDVSGKVTGAYRDAARQQPVALYAYDDRGFRVSKASYNAAGQLATTTLLRARRRRQRAQPLRAGPRPAPAPHRGAPLRRRPPRHAHPPRRRHRRRPLRAERPARQRPRGAAPPQNHPLHGHDGARRGQPGASGLQQRGHYPLRRRRPQRQRRRSPPGPGQRPADRPGQNPASGQGRHHHLHGLRLADGRRGRDEQQHEPEEPAARAARPTAQRRPARRPRRGRRSDQA